MRKMGTVFDLIVAAKRSFATKNGRCPYFNKGMTFLEIMLVIAILGVLTSLTFMLFYKMLPQRTVEGEIEKLAGIIRSAQARATETETAQAIFLSRYELLWLAYKGKTINQLEVDCNPEEGEEIRNHVFKNNVEIRELWLEREQIIPIPNAVEGDIAILIDEKGRAINANITMGKENETNWLVVNGKEVNVGKSIEEDELPPIGQIGQSLLGTPVTQNEEILICETEPLLARGWQTVQINEVDKVDEIKIRIKTDPRLEDSVHFHVYVVPGTYKNKPVAHGVSPISTPTPATVLFSGHVYLNNGPPIVGVTLTVSLNGATVTSDVTDANGYYEMTLAPGFYYHFVVAKTGYSTSNMDVWVDGANTTKNFNLQVLQGGGGSPSLSSTLQEEIQNIPFLPLGEWNHEYNTLIANAMSVYIHEFNTPKLYYLYKDSVKEVQDFMTEFPTIGTSTLPRYVFPNTMLRIDFNVTSVSLNALSNTGSSFPVGNYNTLEARWEPAVYNNEVFSKLASQPIHSSTLTGSEINPGHYSNWLIIPMQNMPAGTEFLRIAVSAYHIDNGKDKALNLYPTSNSKHKEELFVDSSLLDYQTDPMVAIHPWLKWGNEPLWLSNYGYMLKPLTRSSSNMILAAKGPYDGENYIYLIYQNKYEEYKNLWYGSIFLDWDKLLGDEGILWLLGWVSGTFGFDKWQYKQLGDTYHSQHLLSPIANTTHKAAPAHYWLKSFGTLLYWHNFNYAGYFSPENVPKRIQLPINLFTENTGTFFPLWEKPASTYPPYESSSLSMGFLNESVYPLWLATLSPVFGQSKISCSPDLYSSYFYMMQRINHIIQDTGAWYIMTAEYDNAVPIANYTWSHYPVDFSFPFYSDGNLDKWRLEIEDIDDGTGVDWPRQTWWSWYTNIPWAKGTAFPIPSNLAPREGWEVPVIEPYPPDNLFTKLENGLTTLNSVYVDILKNQPNTIFMSTAHYPLGEIQIKVKK